jgi:FkbM family methyltransferase
MLTLNTQILFKLLTKALQPSNIIDIGSMDGSDALALKNLVRRSSGFAFEANPHNFLAMTADRALKKSGIQVIHKAVSNENGIVSFYLAQQISSGKDWRKGTSSLLKRKVNLDRVQETAVDVEAITLNTFLTDRNLERCALWIDVEGAAYQVLSGANLVSDRILIGHVEVEEVPVWSNQMDAKAVVNMLSEQGFCCVARGRGSNQHDIVFVDGQISDLPKVKLLLYAAFFLTMLRKYLGKYVSIPLLKLILFLTPPGCISEKRETESLDV